MVVLLRKIAESSGESQGFAMLLPYQVSCAKSHPRLYRLSDGRFQVVEPGCLAPLMIGHQYVLVETEFAEYIETLDLPGVNVRSAVVYEPRFEQEFLDYKELNIESQFSFDAVHDIDWSGERLRLLDGEHLFATPLLKHRLCASSFTFLRFTEGFSEFAGGKR